MRTITSKKHANYFLAAAFMCLFISVKTVSAQVSAIASGNWSNPAIWSSNPLLPQSGDDVTIGVSYTVAADMNSALLNSLTVNGTLNIINAAGASVSVDGNITIGTNAAINNHGKLDMVNYGYAFTIAANGTYLHDPRNGAQDDESIFFNSHENFAPTSNLTILKWYDETIPLGNPTPGASQRVETSNFGNVTLSVPGIIWDQDGNFALPLAPYNRIKGSFTVTAGQITMDDGTGATQNLGLQAVTISGTGNIVFQQGAGRPLNLTCNNFIDNSTSPLTTSIMYQSTGTLVWNVNGILSLNHNFSMIEGTLSENGNGTLNVTADAIFGSGNIEFIKQCNAPLAITVGGTTTIGAVNKFRFIDGNTGNLTFTTNTNLVISGGNDNIFVGGNPGIPQATGKATVVVGQDFTVTGSTLTYFINSNLNINKASVTVGRDFVTSAAGADVRIANSSGAVTFKTVRDFNMGGGNFTGQLYPLGAGIDSLIAGQDFIFNSATAANYMRANYGSGNTFVNVTRNCNITNSGAALGQGVCMIYGDKTQTGNLTMAIGGQYTQDNGRFIGIYDGAGNITFTSNTGSAPFPPFTLNNGDFRGIYNVDSANAGTSIFNLQSMTFNGGTWMMHYGINPTSAIATLGVTNNCAVNFANASDQFMLAGLPVIASANNLLIVNTTIGGNLSIGGANGTFVSSKASGNETVIITGNFTLSGGNNSFNIVQFSGYPFGHDVTLNVTGNMNVSGGNTFLSAENGVLTSTIQGSFTMSAGTLSLKGAGAFLPHVININGAFTQSGGTFYLHNNSTVSTNDVITLNLNSDFNQSAGVINFDNNASAASATHIMNLFGANYNISGTGSITHAAAGTGTIFGTINFSRAGTINFSRTGSHDIQQVKQYIISGNTLVLNTGNLQIASNSSNAIFDLLSVKFGGTLDLKANQIYSNASAANSYITVETLGRLRTQNIHGLYDNTNLAAINNVGAMNFNLNLFSVVEYYGSSTQVLTGIGVGIATLAQHKYATLEINFQGPTGQFVYPTNIPTVTTAIYVRNQLSCKAGELNLDDDHVTSNGGGRTITIESSATNGIVSIPGGYIRSEVENGTGIIKWQMAAATGIHKIPFGYFNGVSVDDISFSYAPSAGTTGDVSIATYHTIANNQPYPPTVTHVNNLVTGTDNSAQTVDRFWNINVSGLTPPSPDITFTCAPIEYATVTTPLRAQKWMFPTTSWSNPFPGTQSNLAVNNVKVAASNLINGWWTLVALTQPLPVELVNFATECDDKNMVINWTTASETNNDYFTLDKSRDGKNFEVLATVKGSGNSSSLKNYSAVDKNPYAGITFYRLSQTDRNSHTETFKPISAKACINEAALQLTIVPDDAVGTQLWISSSANQDFQITVTDLAGKQQLVQKNNVVAGFNKVDLNTKNLSSGIYLVNLRGTFDNLTQRFLVNKDR
jgi:hypothetical protein